MLRIQEGVNGSDSSQKADPKSSSVQIGSVTLSSNSAIAIGLAKKDQEKFGADSISIDHVTVLDGEFSGIVQGATQDKPVQIGTIDIGNVEFDLGAKNKDKIPQGLFTLWTLLLCPRSLLLVKKKMAAP